jgi:hypothetical protein
MAGSLVVSGSMADHLEQECFGAVSAPCATTEPRRKWMSGLMF